MNIEDQLVGKIHLILQQTGLVELAFPVTQHILKANLGYFMFLQEAHRMK